MSAPRYLSQNFAIRISKKAYEIYRRSVAIIERTHDFASELAIFSEIFSSQEYHRILLWCKSLPLSQGFRGWFTGSYAHGPFAGKDDTAHHTKQNPDEFDIGLGFSGELSMSTSERPESLTLARQKNLPQYAMASMPPFWTPTSQGLPSDETWSDLNLFPNSYTHAASVMIRNNITANSDIRQKQ